MLKILEKLKNDVGVKAGFVITKDGIPVTLSKSPYVDMEAAAANISLAVKHVQEICQNAKLGQFTQIVVNSSFGKMAFVDSGDTYLVVVLDRDIDLDLTMLSIESAAYSLKNVTKRIAT